jgi:hypothetical protein
MLERRIVWGSGLAVRVVLLAVALAWRDGLLESYWLWRLRAGDAEERRAAVERLVDLRSPRVVKVLRDIVRETYPKAADLAMEALARTSSTSTGSTSTAPASSRRRP